jgi:hypothetical protein
MRLTTVVATAMLGVATLMPTAYAQSFSFWGQQYNLRCSSQPNNGLWGRNSQDWCRSSTPYSNAAPNWQWNRTVPDAGNHNK